MLDRGNLSRRGFMNRSVAALTLAGLPAWHARDWFGAAARAEDKAPGANGKLNIGVIGVGPNPRRSNALYGEAKKFKDRVNFTMVCDVDGRHVDHAVKQYKTDGYEVKGTKDFRDLVTSKDVDAVIVATPDHWHAIIAIDAMKAGKDVYCEKPLTLTDRGSAGAAEGGEGDRRVLQTGSQQRTEMGGKFRLAAELVRAGRIGKVKTIECRIGDNPTSGPIPEVEPPKELDWDMWLGPTPKVPYRLEGREDELPLRVPLVVRVQRRQDDRLGRPPHRHRPVVPRHGRQRPDRGRSASRREAVRQGRRLQLPPRRSRCSTPTRTASRWKSPWTARHRRVNGLVDKDGNAPKDKDGKERRVSGGENGVLVIGDKGTLFVSRGLLLASDKSICRAAEGRPEAVPDAADEPHGQLPRLREDAARRRSATWRSAAGSVIVCHIGTIALRSGLKLRWDPKANVFNTPEGNKHLARERRGGWKIS